MKRLFVVAALAALASAPLAQAAPPLLDGCTYSYRGPDINVPSDFPMYGFTIDGPWVDASASCSRAVLGCAMTVDGLHVLVDRGNPGTFVVSPPSVRDDCGDGR